MEKTEKTFSSKDYLHKIVNEVCVGEKGWKKDAQKRMLMHGPGVLV